MSADYTRVAIEHAAKGWHVFPAQGLEHPTPKAPFPGFRWAERATTNVETVAAWFTMDYPGAVPAVLPGLARKTVIDIDRRPGGVDGFSSLMAVEADIPESVFRGTSLSGNGWHWWFRGETTSVNGFLPGVDRKSRGGYVLAPYDLPEPKAINRRLPMPLEGGTPQGDELHPYGGCAEDWLRANLGLTPSHRVAAIVRGVQAEAFVGHDRLLSVQAELIHLAREGHGGVPEALDLARQAWLANPHRSAEDPAREWTTALRTGIAKFGGNNE